MPTRSQGTAQGHDLSSLERPGPASRWAVQDAVQDGQWSPSRLPVGPRGEVTYRTRHLHPDVRAVQWGVATLPGPPLSSVRPFLVLPAPHGEGEQVPARPPPVPRGVAVSILLLGRGRKTGHGRGPGRQRSPSQDPKRG